MTKTTQRQRLERVQECIGSQFLCVQPGALSRRRTPRVIQFPTGAGWSRPPKSGFAIILPPPISPEAVHGKYILRPTATRAPTTIHEGAWTLSNPGPRVGFTRPAFSRPGLIRTLFVLEALYHILQMVVNSSIISHSTVSGVSQIAT